ncbi:MAG: threonine--tRNA ligase [Acidimicrobiales bacterium]
MADEIDVILPDGSRRHVPAGTTGAELAQSIGQRLALAAVAVEIDGELRDLASVLHDRAEVRVVTADSDEGREVLRHSTAHVMAQAVTALWPGAHYAIGPAISDGFYYDFELPGDARFADADLAAVESKMREIMAQAQPFVREEHSVAEGLDLFGDQPYKLEIIEAVRTRSAQADIPVADAALTAEAGAGDEAVSAYRNTEAFVDLCRGPHVPSTDRLGHFKLTRVAGAYWRGDEHRQQLQRIYGTAWESEKALAEHLGRLEEADRRDHRKLGAALDLFSFPPEIGSGLPVFHPKGGIVRKVMEDYSRARHEAAGYEFVYTPHITKSELFEVSGHLDWFADGMFPPIQLDGSHQYYLKPMNCPFHILVFKARQRSYRELPMRLFEFGTVYRYEQSGVIHGLTRVRGLTMDDAHIFVTREQMVPELASLLTFVLALLGDYGLSDFYLELSTRPPGKAVGTDEEWQDATDALRAVAGTMDLALVLDEGGGAFYGPKISVQARDAIGRSWQLSTIQLDFQLPQRFEMEYVGPDNVRHRPIMIHRALFGSVERFFGVLLEHYAGAFPTWLAPVQVRVLPVRDDHGAYGEEVRVALARAGVRVDLEPATEPLGSRIRRAKVEKLPYIIVVGGDDVAARTVGVNPRGSERPERGVALTALLKRLEQEISPPMFRLNDPRHKAHQER